MYESQRTYYARNKDKILQKNAIYRKLNQDKINTQRKQYYLDNKEKISQSVRSRKDRPQNKFTAIKAGAKQRKIHFNLEYEDYLSLYYNRDCYWCGTSSVNGLDRVDSDKGYTLDNIVSCCSVCNKAKNEFESYIFIQMCVAVAKRHGGY